MTAPPLQTEEVPFSDTGSDRTLEPTANVPAGTIVMGQLRAHEASAAKFNHIYNKPP